jgi:hypothetical protein
VYCNIFYFSKLVYNLLEFPPTHKLIKLLPININEFPPPHTNTHTHTHHIYINSSLLGLQLSNYDPKFSSVENAAN